MTLHSSTTVPDGCLLSNGRYYTLITAAGTGQSRKYGHVVNRWLGDPVEDLHGQFLYLRDLDSGECWSVGRQPIPAPSTQYRMSTTEGQFHLLHECYGISAELTVAASPDDDLEVRRLQLKNVSGRSRRIAVTSYFEAVLNWQGADLAHPAFSKLFLQTEYHPDLAMVLVKRRPRGNDETWPTLIHGLSGGAVAEWETDRLRFLGRGRTAAAPASLDKTLSGTTGNVLDPCCSLRTVVELPAGEQRCLTFITGISETDADAHQLAQKYAVDSQVEQTFQDAVAAERTLLQELKLTYEQATRFQTVAAAMHYVDHRLVPEWNDVPSLADWNALFGKLGIPRDRMLIVACEGWNARATQEIVKARQYWGTKGFYTNLIVLDEKSAVTPEGQDDRVYTIDRHSLDEEERGSLFNAASLVIAEKFPDLSSGRSPSPPSKLSRAHQEAEKPTTEPEDLQFFNGLGGFTADGSEYVIRLPHKPGDGNRPPQPWINAISNERIGFLVSEAGAGCTWTRNSQAHRLTPWSNDPVSDPYGEALYLRDEESGIVFSPLPGPVESVSDFEVRHGLGYSVFRSECHGLAQRVTFTLPRHEPVKIVSLQLTNRTDAAKRLSLISYHQLILGSLPERPNPIVTSVEPDGSLRAVNLAAGDFAGGITWTAMAVQGAEVEGQSFTCDRLAFLGRHGTPANPAGLKLDCKLDGSIGAGLDPCFVQQRRFTIPAGATVECVMLLGESMCEEEASWVIEKYLNPVNLPSQENGGELQLYWQSLLQGLQIDTPSPILNTLVNGWLVYQTLSCRIWGRTAFYQSSGAYGYRDQLQDAGNLMPLDPQFAREQIRVHARHQFAEGDVLHWWHPEPVERGVRTRFSDDLLWLPLIVADYLKTTGDLELLKVEEPFLSAPLLKDGEDEAFVSARQTNGSGDIYEHCCRAIDRSLTKGVHELPLMGTGDWNDGMNRVGREGRGESVWLGFFLYRILGSWIPLCEARGDSARVERYQQYRKELHETLNDQGWDGEWYRRAYYDNGDPLGSKLNDECRIDALAQAWAVLSGAAPPERAASALAAMSRDLISEEEGLIRLLTPPFVKTPNDPGYIKGYVAGIRENGGQYTHAACWAVMALAEHGENQRALKLLEMLSPIAHAESPEDVERYKVEPYSVAADIYGAPPHIGRGGWTWYTGSSGWMYRVAIESILGVRIENGDTLVVTPCVPDDWPEYRVSLRRPNGIACEIVVTNPNRHARQIIRATVDGVTVEASGRTVRVPLTSGPPPQHVEVTLG